MTGDDFILKISKEQLGTLQPEKFEGEIVVVTDPADVEKAVLELRSFPVIGFDTETKPSFQKGRINNVALLQLSGTDKSFLFRLNVLGLPDALVSLLQDESVRKVGLSVKDDFHSLSKLCRIEPKGFVDLQEYVRDFHIADSALTKIHAIIFGRRISKSQQLSNWELPSLNRRQQEYAALDAKACLDIYNYLQSGSFVPADSMYKVYPEEADTL